VAQCQVLLRPFGKTPPFSPLLHHIHFLGPVSAAGGRPGSCKRSGLGASPVVGASEGLIPQQAGTIPKFFLQKVGDGLTTPTLLRGQGKSAQAPSASQQTYQQQPPKVGKMGRAEHPPKPPKKLLAPLRHIGYLTQTVHGSAILRRNDT